MFCCISVPKLWDFVNHALQQSTRDEARRTEQAERELATRLQEYEDRRLKSNDEKQAMFAHRVKAAGLRCLAAWMKRNEPRMLAEPLVTVGVEPHLSAATGIIQLQVKMCISRGEHVLISQMGPELRLLKRKI